MRAEGFLSEDGQAAVCPPSPCKHSVTALFCLIDLFSSGLLGRRLWESAAPVSLGGWEMQSSCCSASSCMQL